MDKPLVSPSLWKPDNTEQRHAPLSKKGAFEIKFLVDEALVEKLISNVSLRMQLDPHANPATKGYSVEGIYFETEERDVYRRTPGYSRRKYRVRRYAEGSEIFLERKSKRKGMVTKRRIQLEPSGLADLLNSICEPERCSPAVADVTRSSIGPADMEWFRKRIDRLRLRPTLCIHYDRVAFLQMDNSGPIRLTIDRSIGCCSLNHRDFPSGEDYRRIVDGKCILELKYRESLPNCFREVIDEFNLISESVSKFRNAIVACGLVPPTDQPLVEGNV